ncbi:hypothetical protein Pan97_19940 [Bremerella volcania]|uniref:Tim44-like domain protein n=1 Tax=Bremerella volcania TaxID=2527984 RepID=A0A518C6Z0_9BACT|nr:hypothetical protein [Bremerella volcania]QDU74974.1 hypothetical protein Pan97_19940 [Bremerella volcania]
MWIFEQSLPIIIMAVIGGAILAGTMLQTGKQLFLYLLIGWIAICALLLALEYSIVTDGERIEAVIYRIAEALEANDAEGVKSYISSDAPQLKAEAERQMAYVQIESVKLKRNLEVTINPGSTPIIGVAKLNVKMMGHLKNNQEWNGDFATFMVLTFQQDPDGEWRVIGYQFFDPRGEQAGEITPPISAVILPGF